MDRRKVVVYALSASTLTLVAPLGLRRLSQAEAAPPPPPGGGPRRSDVVAVGADEEKLVLEVTAANKVRVKLPRAEVGQGITTAVAMMIAEELDARLTDVDIPLADARTDGGNQFTGGSSSVSSLYDPARHLAATARARLVTAAARRWHVPANTLLTRDTMVVAPDGRTATFGSLTAAASAITHPDVPADPKPAARHRTIGRPATRIDARDLVTGKATYAGDLSVAGAKPTVVARSPKLGGTVVSVDDARARAMPGVLAVVRIPSGVAVVAETFHHAFQARDALKIKWAPGPIATLSDAGIRSRLRAALPPLAAPPRGSTQVQGEFEFAFVSHAPMEVLTAVADVRADHAEVWFSSQSPVEAAESIAEAVRLPARAVRVHVVRGGGSFGRRLNYDAAIEAALISKAAGRPVKLMWSRADDIKHGRMRPVTYRRVRASVKDGRIARLDHDATSVNEGPGRGLDLPIPMGAWRSVDSGTSRAAEEVMLDEVARSLHKDEVAFRRTTLHSAAAKAVLDKVTAGRWGRRLPPHWGQGVAVHEEYGSFLACLAEIDATDARNPRVTAMVMAVDVGTVINPRGLEAQLMGAAMDGISTILYAGLHIDRGAVRESTFADFHYARHRQSPLELKVHIMPSKRAPGGAGELGVPASAGAVANAYARATGTKPRRFPIISTASTVS
ncbi:molybdopterin cofactor-binding domain-containing protein [Actinoplanes sp. NPDC051475]|uniref:xanthine dehydrogenase family protein molybdopterin-binding subunit n=1 Tax=Actinoplanes sp. NPDC051475 TaxID=3157225 RepID=UPI00344DA694